MKNKVRVALFNDTSREGHYGCDIVMSNLISNLTSENMEVVFNWPVNSDWRRHTSKLPAMGSIDLLVVNGEGTMHHSADNRMAMALAELGELGKRHYSVPAILLNASIFNNDKIFYDYLKDFDLITVRDTASLTFLKEHSIDSTVLPDLTLSKDWPGSSTKRSGVGVTDSVIRQIDASLRSLAKQEKFEFRPMHRAKPSFPVGRNLLKPRKIAGAAYRLYKYRNKLNDVVYQNSADFLHWIESKELIVTGRYHTVTLCLLTRTPFVAVSSNTAKIEALLYDVFGNTNRLLKEAEISIKNITKNKWQFSTKELAAIESFINKSLKSHSKIFNQIKEILT